MQVLPRIILILLFVVAGASAAFWSLKCDPSSPNSVGCFFSKCVFRKDAASSLQQNLESKLFGQDHLLEGIVYMIKRRDVNNPKPIGFHAAGDYGTGKSYMVQLLSKAIFKSPDYSTLLISGWNLAGSEPETIRTKRDDLYNMVVRQLQKCPSSLIVVDDAQYVHALVLTVMIQFMEETGYVTTVTGQKIDTRHAIFGFLSDFASEGFTSGKTLEQLKQMVEDSSKQIWNYDPRLEQLIFNVFPFKQQNLADMTRIMNHTVQHDILQSQIMNWVTEINYSSEVSEFMATNCMKKNPNGNGRSAAKWIDTYFTPQLVRAVESHEGHLSKVFVTLNNKGSFNFQVEMLRNKNEKNRLPKEKSEL